MTVSREADTDTASTTSWAVSSDVFVTDVSETRCPKAVACKSDCGLFSCSFSGGLPPTGARAHMAPVAFASFSWPGLSNCLSYGSKECQEAAPPNACSDLQGIAQRRGQARALRCRPLHPRPPTAHGLRSGPVCSLPLARLSLFVPPPLPPPSYTRMPHPPTPKRCPPPAPHDACSQRVRRLRPFPSPAPWGARQVR